MHAPEIELLWWEGCPSTQRALAELREALREVGLGELSVRMREIRTDGDAVSAGFCGSPTILIDGADLAGPPGAPGGAGAGAAEDEPVGLTCRIYRRRDGTLSPTPDPDDLREALRLAAGASPEPAR